VLPDVVTPLVALVLVVPVTVLLVNLMAAGPALMAMRTRPAPVLREE
jgi:hypothetical protein